MYKVAILYQAAAAPVVNGLQKPMKPGGYSDSGADIAYTLYKNGVEVIVPVDNPEMMNDLDWVFPDTTEGIQAAIDKGADTLWLNTVLYKNHSIEAFFRQNITFVGQIPGQVDRYDNKWVTNHLLHENGIFIPDSLLVSEENIADFSLPFDFPLVIKPIRGRGSQGVLMVHNRNELDSYIAEMLSGAKYGSALYIEKFLAGQEITVTVMPAGTYSIDHEEIVMNNPWCLPPVKRFNHKNGIAPYNGTVAVIENSALMNKNERNSPELYTAYEQCILSAKLLDIKAPIRIDCRSDENGVFFLFDLNMKPNMTGASRPHRSHQDSLTSIAARGIGWSYFDLLSNMLQQRWKR